MIDVTHNKNNDKIEDISPSFDPPLHTVELVGPPEATDPGQSVQPGRGGSRSHQPQLPPPLLQAGAGAPPPHQTVVHLNIPEK